MNEITEIIVYNILFWVPYIWVCSLPAKLMQLAINGDGKWNSLS